MVIHFSKEISFSSDMLNLLNKITNYPEKSLRERTSSINRNHNFCKKIVVPDLGEAFPTF